MTRSLFILKIFAACLIIYPSVGQSKPTKEITVASTVPQWKASEYMQLEPSIKLAYLRGLAGGLGASPILGVNFLKVKPLQECSVLMTADTLRMITDAYVVSHPESSNTTMDILFPLALISTCKSKGIDIQSK